MMRKLSIVSIAVMLSASVALASWYDEYDAGIAAIRKGNWQAAVTSMSAAIRAKPKENNKERTYGTQFYNYHPYYYRGVAYLNLGQYDKAISDLEAAEGIGEENLGSIDSLMQRAKTKLAQSNTPEPQPAAPVQPAAPQPQPARPVVPVPQPSAPVISPAMRQQATAAINEAKQAMTNASARKANASPQFASALQQLADANQKQAAARTDDDLNAAIAAAGNAKMYFDSAQGATAVATSRPTPLPVTKVTAATNATVGTLAQRVRSALEAYFAGDFETATSRFQTLSADMPRNGWIFAFLGASQYSMYAFEADEGFKSKAEQSFKKAKQLRFKELPEKYFSRRIRRAFKEVAG